MKMIKLWYVLTSLIAASLMSCADQKSSDTGYAYSASTLIVGGSDLKYSDAAASSIVFISTENDQGHNEICTGTFISKNLILTAAHCIAKDKDGMSVSFRYKDYSTTQNISDIEIVEIYKLDFSPLGVERNDMGLIQFKGGLPQGATIAMLPNPSQSANFKAKNLIFSAIGYGRNTGIQSEDPLAQTGEGILRYKTLTSKVITPLMDNFKIDQFKNKGGVCFGDSGGPALIKDPKTNQNMIVGVASAVLTQRTGAGIDMNDDCQNESMYLNMYYYAKYFSQYVKIAIEAKAKIALASNKK